MGGVQLCEITHTVMLMPPKLILWAEAWSDRSSPNTNARSIIAVFPDLPIPTDVYLTNENLNVGHENAGASNSKGADDRSAINIREILEIWNDQDAGSRRIARQHALNSAGRCRGFSRALWV